MVATILSLRWRILVHQFRRDWWRLLFVVAGAIWSVSLVPALAIGSARLASQNPDLKEDALVAIAGLIALGWLAVPLLATGVDDSLEPARFAAWGVPASRLAPGLQVAAFTTVPALFFAGVAAVMASTWRGQEPAGWVMLAAAVGAALTLVAWVASARVAAMWAARVLSHRRGRWLVAATLAVGAAAVAWVIVSIRANGFEEFLGAEAALIVELWARTPLGAGMAAPAAIAQGNGWGALWRLVMLAAWAILLLLAWRDGMAHAMEHPIVRGGGARRRADAVLAAVRTRRLLTPTTSAVLARTLRSWRSDSRYVAQVIGTLALPIVIVGIVVTALGFAAQTLFVIPLILGVTIGWGRHNDLAYDSSAVWLDVVSAVPGRDVMRGRALGVAAWAVPAVLATTVVAAAASGAWLIGLSVAGVALGMLGASLGVAACCAVLLPYRVPAPGESPFGSEAGSIGASLGSQLVASLGTGVVIPVLAAPLVAALVWSGPWWVIAGVLGLVAGPVLGWAGTTLAGSLYERRAGSLVGALT